MPAEDHGSHEEVPRLVPGWSAVPPQWWDEAQTRQSSRGSGTSATVMTWPLEMDGGIFRSHLSIDTSRLVN